ncbi:MAG TPA: hypothetical protein VGM83_03790 [Devosiaceae bacterium]|jgi:hypothetical protein
MSSVREAAPAEPAQSRFAGTLFDVLDKVRYARIRPDDFDDPVYRLRYEAYRREDFLPPNPSGTYTDPLDHSDNAYCYGVFIEDRLVSSIRIHHITPQLRLSPSMTVYDDILNPLLDQGLTFIDPTRFTADHEASLAYPALPYLTLRVALMASEHFEVDYCLSSVRPEHAPFYRRVFRCAEMGPERGYNGLTFPIVMLATPVPTALPRVLERYPFFRSTSDEREKLFGQGRLRFGEPITATARLAQNLRYRLEGEESVPA